MKVTRVACAVWLQHIQQLVGVLGYMITSFLDWQVQQAPRPFFVGR